MEDSRKEEFNYDDSSKAVGGKDEVDDEETRATRRREEMRGRQDGLTKRGEGKDFLSRLLIERNEAEQEETILRAEEARKLRCLQSRQTQKLGEELLRIKVEDIREQKHRQSLRKDSTELRRLEDQLRSAYAAKDARLQLSEREIRRENENTSDIEEARAIQGWYRNDRSEEQRMLEARRKKDEYRRDLQDQLVLNHRLRQRKAEETRRERKLVEEVVEVLRAEELENQRRKRETASRLRAEERSFLEARELWKLREKQVLLKERRDCTRILTDKMAEGERSDEAKAAESAVREAMLKKIWMKIATEERRAKEAEADRAFAGCLEEDRRRSVIEEGRKADERRARGIDYGKTLRVAIENNAIRYTEEILENRASLKLNRKLDEARRIFIDEERLRILGVDEPRLRGFPKPGMSLRPEVAESANGAIPSFRDQKQSFENPSKLLPSLVNDPAVSNPNAINGGPRSPYAFAG